MESADGKLVQISQLSQLTEAICSPAVLTEFVEQYLSRHKDAMMLLSHFSHMYVYILTNEFARVHLTRAQAAFLRKEGALILGYFLLHENRCCDYEYVEKNAFVTSMGWRLESDMDPFIDMFNKYRSSLSTSLIYVLPHTVTQEDVAFWYDYFRTNYSVETQKDVALFSEERNVEREGADWKPLISHSHTISSTRP